MNNKQMHGHEVNELIADKLATLSGSDKPDVKTGDDNGPVKDDAYFTNLWLKQKNGGMLQRESAYNEQNILNNKFNQIEAPDEQTRVIATQVKRISERYKQGNKFNCVFSGMPGTGKTFLATCLLNDVNENASKPLACLFVSAPLLQELALARVRGKDWQQVEEMNHLEKSIRSADLMVLDDLGSETSMQVNNIKTANETTQKILFTASDSRQGKSTIITTNYTSAELQMMYNPKIISRLMTNKPEHIINFAGIADRRISQN